FNGSNEVIDIVTEGTTNNRLSIGHASGAGFTASTPVEDLHINENAGDGISVGFVLPSDPDSPQDIVSDGLFMEASPTSTQYGVTGSFGDWTVTQASVDLFSTSDWQSPLGGRVVNLDGSAPGAIEQTLTTTAGKQYQVVFALTGDFSGGDAVKDLRVSAAGANEDFTATQTSNWSWGETGAFENRSFTFTADAETTTLRLESLEDVSSTYGPYIADVRVIEIPQAISTILNNDSSLSYDAATDKFYRYVDSTLDFDAALANATGSELNGVSGQLATVRSAYENEIVRSILQDNSANSAWLGGTDETTDGTWAWLNGSTEESVFYSGGDPDAGVYSNFQSGEPNGGASENHIQMFSATGLWNDHAESNTIRSIIEWDASEVLSSYTFSLTDDAGGRFAIDSSTGEITVADTSQLDYETDTSHNVTVEVTDAAGNTYSEAMSITIDDGFEISQSVPAAQVATQDTPLTFTGANAITVSDGLASGDTPLQVYISTNFNGTLNLSQTTGLYIGGGSDGGSFMTIQGTESDINAALDGMTFTPANGYTGPITINMTTSLGADLEGRY
ncbi:MAG: DUF642 domain-containing protein, partial [Planctomycetota bacterium]